MSLLPFFLKNQWYTENLFEEDFAAKKPDALYCAEMFPKNKVFDHCVGEYCAIARLSLPYIRYERKYLKNIQSCYFEDLCNQHESMGEYIACANDIYTILDKCCFINCQMVTCLRQDYYCAGYSWTSEVVSDPLFKAHLMAKVLFGKFGKRKCIYFQGRSNCGKTTLCDIICSFYEHYQRGTFNIKGATSDFWFQHLLNRSIYVGDEIVACEKTVQVLKQLLEGNPNLSTDCKYTRARFLVERPSVLMGNTLLWDTVSKESEPLMERMVWFSFRNKHLCPPINRERGVLRLSWCYILHRALAKYPIKSRAQKRTATHFSF